MEHEPSPCSTDGQEVNFADWLLADTLIDASDTNTATQTGDHDNYDYNSVHNFDDMPDDMPGGMANAKETDDVQKEGGGALLAGGDSGDDFDENSPENARKMLEIQQHIAKLNETAQQLLNDNRNRDGDADGDGGGGADSESGSDDGGEGAADGHVQQPQQYQQHDDGGTWGYDNQRLEHEVTQHATDAVSQVATSGTPAPKNPMKLILKLKVPNFYYNSGGFGTAGPSTGYHVNQPLQQFNSQGMNGAMHAGNGGGSNSAAFPAVQTAGSSAWNMHPRNRPWDASTMRAEIASHSLAARSLALDALPQPPTVDTFQAKIEEIRKEKALIERQIQEIQQNQQQRQNLQQHHGGQGPANLRRDAPYAATQMPMSNAYGPTSYNQYNPTQYAGNSVNWTASPMMNHTASNLQPLGPNQPQYALPTQGYSISAMTGNLPAQQSVGGNGFQGPVDEHDMGDDTLSDGKNAENDGDPLANQRPTIKREPSAESIIPASSPSKASTGPEIGSWALPRFEVQRQALESKDDCPSVKVSLPNMVREELLLSPDYEEQEIHFLTNIFLPYHQGLDVPDPYPAKSLLNFHTIAVMVIEAYSIFEIGDEAGTGRGHWHGFYSSNDPLFKLLPRVRDAADADPTEIYFAVMDRWRAGMDAGKRSFKMIRGIQEFCELALDMIYYIQENGMIRPVEKPARKERSDKGVKREPKKKDNDDGKDGDDDQGHGKAKGKGKQKVNVLEAKRGAKRGGAAKVNTLQPTKKAKTTTQSKDKKKATPGVTVTRRR
ncbi:hypothetical protein IQ07DRAFT_604186 [Pyrenochaeta sp. DS3sAY3a]|nr:hypothetical protein IQ07DRAFT_604186 [Pyrenochaeta sp. DS3sAY3a]